MPQVLAPPERLIVPRKFDGPLMRMSADQPGAAMADVRGPTRTIVSVPLTELKLLPCEALVSVPGPTNGSRATSLSAACAPSAEQVSRNKISRVMESPGFEV